MRNHRKAPPTHNTASNDAFGFTSTLVAARRLPGTGYRVCDRRSADKASSRIFSMPHFSIEHRLSLNSKLPETPQSSERDQRRMLAQMSPHSGSTTSQLSSGRSRDFRLSCHHEAQFRPILSPCQTRFISLCRNKRWNFQPPTPKSCHDSRLDNSGYSSIRVELTSKRAGLVRPHLHYRKPRCEQSVP